MTQSSARKRFKQFTRSVKGYAQDLGHTIAGQASRLGDRFDTYEFRMRDMVPVSKYVLGLGTTTAASGAVAAPSVTVATIKQTHVPSVEVDAAMHARHAAKQDRAEKISAFHYGTGLTTDGLTAVSDALEETENTDAIQDVVLDVQGAFPNDAERVTHRFQEHPDIHAQAFADVWQQQRKAVQFDMRNDRKVMPIFGKNKKAYVSGRHGMRRVHPVTGKRKMHDGLDIDPTTGNKVGAAVYMPFEQGIITEIESRPGKLNKISIEMDGVPDDQKITVTFMHVRPDRNLRVGSKWDASKNPDAQERIASTAHRDRWSTGPHVHVEAYDAKGRNITKKMQQHIIDGTLDSNTKETRAAQMMDPDVRDFIRSNPDMDVCDWEAFQDEKTQAFANGTLSKKQFEQQRNTFDAVDEAVMQLGLESADSVEVFAYRDLKNEGAVLDSALAAYAEQIVELQADADDAAYRKQLEENPPQEIAFDIQLDESASLQSTALYGTGKDIKLDYVPIPIQSDAPNLFDVNREIIQKQETDRMVAVILQAKENGVFDTDNAEPKSQKYHAQMR